MRPHIVQVGGVAVALNPDCFQYSPLPVVRFSLDDRGFLPVHPVVLVPCMGGNAILSVTPLHCSFVFCQSLL